MAAEAAILSLHPVLALPFCSATGANVTFAQEREAIRWRVAQEQAERAGQGQGQGQGGATPRDSQDGSGPGSASGAGAGSDAGPDKAPDPRGAPKRALHDDASRANPPRAPQGRQRNEEPPPRPTAMPGFLAMLWAYATCAGLLEELEKMLPVFGLIWAAASSRRTDSKRWGVHEPLDAIVYASAAALAFILIETFSTDSQYVGGAIASALDESAAAGRAVALLKFPLALLRVLDALSGHIAYSGYFAYFVGLGLLRPNHRERYWIGGWIAAAFFHGLYDATTMNAFMRTVSTAITFFLLIAAILNARKVSPTREENFATRAIPHAKRS
jgi:RsiW-degrading membrane proteinase PrsW (M82 family)